MPATTAASRATARAPAFVPHLPVARARGLAALAAATTCAPSRAARPVAARRRAAPASVAQPAQPTQPAGAADAAAPASAPAPAPGTLVRLRGLRAERGLNGRLAVVSATPVSDGIAVLMLPYTEGDALARVGRDSLEPVTDAARTWPADVAAQYGVAAAHAAFGALQTSVEEGGGPNVARAVCERAVKRVRGVDDNRALPMPLFVLWLSLRAGGDARAARRVRADIIKLDGDDARAVAEEMTAVLKAERDGPPPPPCACCSCGKDGS